ncbi:hypothetical protein BCR33DRAFT_792350 [Rhizoclosmatium globosum]|uniref:Alginate lyase 2 domain-containing protein n=1 Tax=Rhizoclosmatium globosum TaxID=329046 RepID=A0A1Y2B9H9_9FUNG|nr:hypothetical protein BCR33DRAFT_792350 [Rhizoclosmatium globosum]|eukprot:ORY31137.1 hypothetical protein BCR33DRAFT_792350 [Rhizoclosmatium globosum]
MRQGDENPNDKPECCCNKSADSVQHDFNLTAKIDFVSSPRFVIFSQVFAASEGCQYNFRAINLGGTNNPYSIYVCGQSGCVEMDGHYVPGSLFTLQLSASNNVVKVNYKNLVSQAVWQKDMPLVPYNDYYYKAGSYCQVTTSTDPANAYCQVTFNALSVTW